MYVRVTRKRIGFLVVLAVLVTAGGVAYASIPSSDGTIRGCYQKENGQLRVVDKASDCRNSELAISWNQKGPTGVAGAIGAQGPKGDKGATGAQGAKGDQGATGAQGTQGLKGDTGGTGAQGPQGLTGDVGAAGAQGAQGIQGIQGERGLDGVSVTTRSLSTGDTNCPTGGVEVDSTGAPLYVCNGSSVPLTAACDDGNSATDDALVGGLCRYTNRPNGASCSPPVGGVVDSGRCIVPPVCDDGNSATDDVLLGVVCSHTNKPNGASCSPPVGGVVDSGRCIAVGVCDDGNSATDDALVGGLCRYTNRPNGASCSPPVGGVVDSGRCIVPPVCDDGNSATDDVLVGVVCSHTNKPNGASCSPPVGGVVDSGRCIVVPVCDDGNPATDDVLVGIVCTYPNKPNGAPCSPPVGGVVDSGSCIVPPVCDDGNPATDDLLVGGLCTHVNKPNGAACSPPVGGVVVSGSCVVPPVCDDGNPATDDVLVGIVCSYPNKPAGAACSPPVGGVADGSGHCIDVSTDTRNCGTLGHDVSNLPHAFGTCFGGVARIAACDSGWFNNDGNAANGCESIISPTSCSTDGSSASTAIDLGVIDDNGSIHAFGGLALCLGQTDRWFRLRMHEVSSVLCLPFSTERYVSQVGMNLNPSGGNLDLHVHLSSPVGSEVVSLNGGASPELVTINWEGSCGAEDNLDVYVDVQSLPLAGAENLFDLTASNQKL